MFRRLAARTGDPAHLDRVERMVRRHFRLPQDQLVLVSEEVPAPRGFPPRETIVRFWTDPDSRFRLRVFKPAAEVTGADLPVAWLLPGLRDEGDPDCC